MKQNIIQEKSFAFAIRIVKAYKLLVEEKREYLLSKQLIGVEHPLEPILKKQSEDIPKQIFFLNFP